MVTIDLNCDMGEGCGNDAELMKYVSSANVACGFHAGDLQTMRATVELALEHGVAIGAHPGYRDRENFGRVAMEIALNDIFDLVAEQIRTMVGVCEENGTVLHHVKPHGALYNQAATNSELAATIARAVASIDPDLILYGLSGSLLISEARKAGLRTASEVFADRTYQPDGSLTPRSHSEALMNDDKKAVAQVLQMIRSRTVTAITGETVEITADTLCIHGDSEHAVGFAKSIREAMAATGVRVMSPRLGRLA
ncbi:MAG TPA: 5-oxoprolinase subunit PxpA [Pyrinomonadaceae bacterium]|nr:5-oxoprolinase subunit PxpA [Pyrinomonadaceae bacterium]